MSTPQSAAAAIRIQGVSYSYPGRKALNDINLEIARGEIFALLGPNGGGKSTLFRLLATLMPLQQGSIAVLGYALPGDMVEIRRRIGVVFQSPSLDRKLTVWENLWHQAALYGLTGAKARDRARHLMAQLQIEDRRNDRAETLSGGLRRRVELAKSMLHEPQLLLMDEPSTGLDPGARADLWSCLVQLRQAAGVTVALTTHLLDEAEKADRIAILDQGQVVALDSPDALRASVGGDSITIATTDPASLVEQLKRRFDVVAHALPGAVRFEQPGGHLWTARLYEAFGSDVQSITVGRPTLEDVFIARTGHRFWTESPA